MSATVKDIVDAGRAAALTTAVLQQWAAKGTPGQRDYLHGFLIAEAASRTASRRARLLKAARLPVAKTLDGYDWAAVTFPAGYGREQLAGLAFADAAEDLVCYGDVGTGKTHLAAALIAAACQAGMPARFFTATALVDHLRRAKADGNLHKELAALAKNRIVAIDELGYIPIDTEGARLLFQVISSSYETSSLIITTNLEFSRWGTVFGDDNMAAAIIDRLVHHGRLLQFRGESYRVHNALMK
ncbi:MAG: IS21-like element helper ATPase IstB [Trebonia sp.]